ncbi:MAG TPA: site-2 protease family protein [Phycisphaerales bacterium]|nr:site-2 protease family protein [Phycisphaerales bacterium]
MGWWVADLLRDNPAHLISHVVWVIAAICLHELAHGWAAIYFGDRTPIETGHMTWNPLVHMGPMSLIMFAVVGIAWGLMPINPNRMRGKHAEAIVALAGPAMNLLLAAMCIPAAALWTKYATGVSDNLYDNFQLFFYLGAVLNIGLATFNLLPIPPLDGSRILAKLSPAYANLINDPRAMSFSLVVFLVVFLWAGRYIWLPGIFVTGIAVHALVSILP